MRIVTIDEILDILNKAGFHILKSQFNFYQKSGLLFAPEKKIKRRVKEGIISYYAEEIIDRLKVICNQKATDLSLKEIRKFLLERDIDEVRNFFKPFTLISDIEAIQNAREWEKDSYYAGKFRIFTEIYGKLETQKMIKENEYKKLEAVRDRLLEKFETKKEKEIIKDIFHEELLKISIELKKKNKQMSDVFSQKEDLGQFLVLIEEGIF